MAINVLILFFCLHVCITTTQWSPCHYWEGAEHYDGMCYKIIQRRLPWEKAQDWCMRFSYHGRLAEPLTLERIRFLSSVVSSVNGTGTGPVWLGARYQDVKGEFTWETSDAPVALDGNIWQRNKPKYKSEDYCIHMSMKGELSEETCVTSSYFICELNVDVYPCSVWEGSIYYDDYCYKIFDEHLSAYDAQESCKQKFPSARLAEPRTEKHITFLRDMVMFISNSFWLGSWRGETGTGLLSWRSGGIVNTSQWAPGEPSEDFGSISISGEGWRLLKVEPYRNNFGYICQLYVGEVCQNSLQGGDFFAGRCYNFHKEPSYLDEAKATCEKSNSILAEPYTEDMFGFVKEFAKQEGGTVLKMPENSSYVTLESYGHTYDSTFYVFFEVQACQDAHVFFWKSDLENDLHQSNQSDSLSDFVSEYYEVVFAKPEDNMISEIKHCQQGACRLLTQTTYKTLECNKTLTFTISWKNGGQLGYEVRGLWKLFIHDDIRMTDINRLGVAMGEAQGEWLIPYQSLSVFLGADDLQTKGTFIWSTSGEDVLRGFWVPNEPSGGEENFSVLTPFYRGLNDLKATDKSRFICQADALVFKYMVVIPESGAHQSNQTQLHITTGQDALVYIDITYRIDSIVYYDSKWLVRNKSIEIPLDVNRLELVGTVADPIRRSVELQSTHEVTVVLFHMAEDRMGSTLVPPVNEMSTQYYILSYSDSEVNNQMTVTATVDNTEVLIKSPCSDTTYFSSNSVDSSRYRLHRGESITVMKSADLSGTIVSATLPVVVYVGTTKNSFFGTTNSWTLGSTDNTLDTVLPISTLSSHYVAFPTGGRVADTYKFMAIFDDTTITIHTSFIMSRNLKKSGDTTTLMLPSSSFFFFESDRIFQVIKISSASQGVSVTSLLPFTLWRREYDFTVINQEETIYLVVPASAQMNSQSVNITINGERTKLNCYTVKGISAYGCSMSLTNGTYHINTSDVSTKFAAYSSSGTDQYRSCHSLGVSKDVEDPLQVFPMDSRISCAPVVPISTCTTINVTAADCVPTATTPMITASTESTTQTTTTTTRNTSMTQNTASTTNAGRPTAARTTEYTAQDQASTVALSQTSQTTQLVQTPKENSETVQKDTTNGPFTSKNTEATPNGEMAIVAIDNDPVTTTMGEMAVETTESSSQTDVTPAQDSSPNLTSLQDRCLSLIMSINKLVNITEEDMSKLTQALQRELKVDAVSTSSYRRSKTSAVDYRPSSTAIGFGGLAMVISVMALFILSDIERFVRFIWMKVHGQ